MTISEQSRVMLAGGGRTRIGTVVALDNLPPYASHAMVMWDTDRGGKVNGGGKAYWHPLSRLEPAP